jgi:uncharacterized protein YndB with AHSA1/START domain
MAASSALRSNTATTEGEREIVATRVFDAPRDLVFRMWTDPRHVGHWWGPKGFTITIYEMDVRPGGVWRFIMHGPDGRDYQNKNVYNEVVPPERLSFSHVSGPLFDSVVTFDAQGEKTLVKIRMIFRSGAERDKTIEEFGAVEGLNQTLGRLEDLLSKSVVITRTFDAPRELVFEAWTDPAHVAQWWGPRQFTNPVCDWNARPGNAIHVDMRGPDGTLFPMGGTFHEVAPPERLVFTTTALDGALEVLNTVTFADDGGKTAMRLQAVVVKASPEADGALAGMHEGWSQSLDKLAEELAETFVISRTFDAPRALVWKAWTERDRLMQWFGPKGFMMFAAKNDLRPGGVFHYALRGPDGSEVWGKWVYREVVPPERLVFVSGFSDPEGTLTRHPMAPTWPLEMLSKVTFTEDGGKTTVTVEWRPLGATDEERKTFASSHASMRQGWGGTFDQFADYLAKG